MNINANNTPLSQAMVDQALSDLTPGPLWCRVHPDQWQAWKMENPEAIGIGAVSVAQDGRQDKATLDFLDGTLTTILAQITNLAVPA